MGDDAQTLTWMLRSLTTRIMHGETVGKQRGSGEYSASEDNAAKNISESRMHEQNNNGRRQYG